MGLNRCGCHPVLYRNALIAVAARLTPDVKMTVHAEAVAMSLLNSLPRLSPASLALLVVLASTTEPAAGDFTAAPVGRIATRGNVLAARQVPGRRRRRADTG